MNDKSKEEVDNSFDSIFYGQVCNIAKKLNLKTSIRSHKRVDIYNKSQMDFKLSLELDTSNLVIVYFVFRTNSWIYDGERTDLHDSQSILFSICSLVLNYSVSLWDVENTFSNINEELYARYATISQPDLSVITQDDIGVKNIELVFTLYTDFQKFLSLYNHMSSKEKKYAWDLTEIRELRERIADCLDINISDIVGNKRNQPDWIYIQVYSKKISVIKSEIVTNILNEHINNILKVKTELIDENNIYYKTEFAKLCFNEEDIKDAKLLAQLLTNESIRTLVTESHLYIISGKWVIAKRGNFGFDRYLKERQNFSERTKMKMDFLFDNFQLLWTKKASPERFESLCRDLLSREPFISRTRTVSPTNQPDRGRDLIAEKIVYRDVNKDIPEDERPLDIKKCLVQCKLSSKTLGIPKGIGPMDALFLGDYDEYILITNAKLSSDYTALLEKIRSHPNYNADWWTHDELEERLKMHYDLLLKYKDIVSYQDLTKSSNGH